MVYYGDNYYNNYAISGYVTIGLWKKVGGSWTMLATEDVQVYVDVGNSPGRQTVNWSFQNTYALGAGVTDVGFTIEGSSDTAVANYLALSWAASASSGERTATPGGEQAAAVVRP